MLPQLPGEPGLDVPPVHLVRELKLPAMHRLVTDPGRVVEGLPDEMASMEADLASGDYEAAEQRIDAALGAVLAGPGHEKRSLRRACARRALWICVALTGLLCSIVWLWG